VGERNEVEAFKAKIDILKNDVSKIKDKWKEKAWMSNYSGLHTATQGGREGDYLFKVNQSTTGVTYLFGKLNTSKRGLDISEVISHTDPAKELNSFGDDVDRESRENELQTERSIGAMRGRIASTTDDISQSVPLGCLFAWSSINSKIVTLTANTVGLLSLYKRYGFELVGSLNPVAERAFAAAEKARGVLVKASEIDKQAASDDYNDKKFAVVNVLMRLTDQGRADLQNRLRPLVNYVGPSLRG
jgi:hypothetical protein